jgi:hypothetical protein
MNASLSNRALEPGTGPKLVGSAYLETNRSRVFGDDLRKQTIAVTCTAAKRNRFCSILTINPDGQSTQQQTPVADSDQSCRRP